MPASPQLDDMFATLLGHLPMAVPHHGARGKSSARHRGQPASGILPWWRRVQSTHPNDQDVSHRSGLESYSMSCSGSEACDPTPDHIGQLESVRQRRVLRVPSCCPRPSSSSTLSRSSSHLRAFTVTATTGFWLRTPGPGPTSSHSVGPSACSEKRENPQRQLLSGLAESGNELLGASNRD
jgi:hypothetical protein